MSLLERSTAFAANAVELDGLRRAASLVTAVGSRASQYEAALGKLRLAAGQFALLRAQGIEVAAEVSSAAGFIHHLTALQAAIAADPAAATSADVGGKSLAPLDSFTSKLAATCQAAWEAHVAAALPQVRGDLLQVLSRVPALRTRAEQFRTLLAQAEARASSVPRSAAEVAAFTALAASCHAAWQALDAEEMPSGVAPFVQAATSIQGASLDLLTEDVETWLEEHKLLSSFVVRAR